MTNTTKNMRAVLNKEVGLYLIVAPILGAIYSYIFVITIPQELTCELAFVIIAGGFLCVFASNCVVFFGTRNTN